MKITKLKAILVKRSINQTELIEAIEKKHGIKLQHSAISKIVSGARKKYSLKTCYLIADSLGLTMNDIYDPTDDE